MHAIDRMHALCIRAYSYVQCVLVLHTRTSCVQPACKKTVHVVHSPRQLTILGGVAIGFTLINGYFILRSRRRDQLHRSPKRLIEVSGGLRA